MAITSDQPHSPPWSPINALMSTWIQHTSQSARVYNAESERKLVINARGYLGVGAPTSGAGSGLGGVSAPKVAWGSHVATADFRALAAYDD